MVAAPKDDEVLVKIHAVSINDWDWGLVQGVPYAFRLLSGFPRPRIKILGSDIAGRVEAVGKNVKHFQPGDEVYGDLSGRNWGGLIPAMYWNRRSPVRLIIRAP